MLTVFPADWYDSNSSEEKEVSLLLFLSHVNVLWSYVSMLLEKNIQLKKFQLENISWKFLMSQHLHITLWYVQTR